MGVKDVGTSALTSKSADTALALVGDLGVVTPTGVQREPTELLATAPDAPVDCVQLLANVKESCLAARASLKTEEGARVAWRDQTARLGAALLALREFCQNDSRTFHCLLSDNGLGEDFISKDDRAGLIGIAEHWEIAERVLATTVKRSWRTIWLDQIKPEVDARRVRTPANPRGGRPRKAPPVQSNEPPEDVAERELIAQCPGPEWRTADKMASTVNRALNFVRDILKSMAARGLVEQRKAADNISIEYRIVACMPVERDAPPDVEALKRQIDDLKFAELEKDELIADLEQRLEEAHTENAGLRQRIAQLESLSGADQHKPDEAIESKPETVH
jgi:hypothetical protein